MNRNTLILLMLVIAGMLGLVLLSQHAIKMQATAFEKAVKQRNALQEIIDSTGNKDSVFNSSLKGKTLVLNISFAVYGEAKKELVTWNKMVDDFKKDSDVVFLLIVPTDSTRGIKDIMQKVRGSSNYKVVINSKVPYGYLTNAKLIRKDRGYSTFPINMVIDKEGRIVRTYMGATPGALDSVRSYLTTITK